jgi:hypothetical protein
MRALLFFLFVATGSTFVTAGENDLFTNTYVVPPTFLKGTYVFDPFSELKPDPPRHTAQEVLENAGVIFTEGCSVIYNPKSSQLVVRNTKDQMELVAAHIDSIISKVEKQIYVAIREVQVDSDFKLDEFEIEGWKLELPPLADNQRGRQAITFDSYEAFRRELASPPVLPDDKKPLFGRSVAGVLTDPQFQILIRDLRKRDDVDFLDTPSTMCRSGHPSMVQVDDRRYGISAILGSDEYMIDLKAFLPAHGEALFDAREERITTPYQVSLGDGQTVVFAESRENGKSRFVFINARLMDPAGMPIHPANMLIHGQIEKGKKVNNQQKKTTFTPHSPADSIKAKK